MAALGVFMSGEGKAQDADLAKQLNNPIANVISVPFQFNYDHNIGPADAGERYNLNIQPVIPVSIAPVIRQRDVFQRLNSSDQSGLGDVVQNLFFSPKEPGPNGIIWGWKDISVDLNARAGRYRTVRACRLASSFRVMTMPPALATRWSLRYLVGTGVTGTGILLGCSTFQSALMTKMRLQISVSTAGLQTLPLLLPGWTPKGA